MAAILRFPAMACPLLNIGNCSPTTELLEIVTRLLIAGLFKIFLTLIATWQRT